MPKYKVKSPLNHDGKDYKIGGEVTITEEQAEPLLGHTLVRPGEVLDQKQVAQGVAAVESEALRLQELREQLTAEQLELQAAQKKLAEDQALALTGIELLKTDREQLDADRAAFEKEKKAATK